MPRIIPIRDLKNTNAIAEMCKETNEPIYVTRNGYGEMVLMSMEAYEKKIKMLELYRELAISEQQFKEGRSEDARSALAALEHEL